MTAKPISLTLFLLASLSSAQPLSYRELRYTGVVGQTTDYTCGPAALATLLTYYYGTPVNEEALTVRAVNDMSRRGKEVVSGLSMLALKNTLAAEGVSATGYKMNIEQLAELMKEGLPVIANVQYPKGHYYLVLAAEGEEVLLADPSWGVRSQPITQFLHAWNGVVLVPQGNETQTAKAKASVLRQVQKWQERKERLRTGA